MQNQVFMSQNASFTIYNASAGSGKTFTLVKEYLKILFKSNNPDQFKRILAITFTNKAVTEMKERIIEVLKTFSSEVILENPDTMFETICEELQIQPSTLHLKAKNVLHTIVHNYAAFDISTIDGFTHRLIRTFAYDLKLPLNFEVELDTDALLNEAVDSLIAKAGSDAMLTSVLVDFAIEKADDDKSWDVSLDFFKMAKRLVSENDIPFINTLKHRTLTDFLALKTQLKKDIKTTETAIVETAQKVLNLIEDSNLQHNDFSNSYLPKHFIKLVNKEFDVPFTNQWQEHLVLETQPLYPKRVSSEIASTIEQLQPQLAAAFNLSKQGIFHIKFLKAFYKHTTPLSVLNAINNELTILKADQNKMLISEFNTLISNEISNQPTPFIYERMGEKFNHFFIDEFQDTSVMQWQNLIPLLDNSLSSGKGSALLVGDAKQAIYRWRGGKAEQFIGLFGSDNPFHIEKNIKNLPANYRSFKEIVSFNNGFFNFLASQVFRNDAYATLYQNAKQTITKQDDGFVELLFVTIEKDDVKNDVFSEQTLKTITKCLENGFQLEDICVLVRNGKEGVAIANYLSQHHIPIISSDTLLINNAPEVQFVNNLLGLLIQPKNNELKIAVLNYATTLFTIENKHAYFVAHLPLSLSQFFKSFEEHNVFINHHELLQLPLYDAAETIVRSFNLVKTSNAYLQFYLDVVLEFYQKKGSDISGFLDYFNKKKEKLSIVSPKGQNAVQIMTIHKSKGLEFPVVIFPFANLNIYAEVEPKEWFPLNKEVYNGFSHTLLNFNADFENYGTAGMAIFDAHKAEQELDNINLLYVTLTRAVEQLYVISSHSISEKDETNNKKFSGLFINYLKHLGMWNDAETRYTFGTSERTSKVKKASTNTTLQTEFISTSKETHHIKIVTKSGMLWDTTQEEAIEKGNLIHNIMAKINTKADIDLVIEHYINTATINTEQAEKLKKLVFDIVTHTQLKSLFNLNDTIYNERDIITKDGVILRPDRVVLNAQNDATIIDYKTGFEDKKHAQQLQTYQDVLQDMNIRVKSKILVYVNDGILVREV